jgi:hypothetical protein
MQSGGTGGAEDLLAAETGNTVGKGERKTLGDELLDVGALDILALLDLDNTENLYFMLATNSFFAH